MSAGGKPPPQAVPVLTDVLEMPKQALDDVPSTAPAASSEATLHETALGDDTVVHPAELVAPMVDAIMRELDRSLAHRVRAAIEPDLERLAERAVQVARDEIALGLREIIERIVADELAQRSKR